MDEEYAKDVLQWTRDEYIQCRSCSLRVKLIGVLIIIYGGMKWPSGLRSTHIAPIELKGCLALYWITNIAMIIVSNSAEASLWLCLYALLGTKKRYLILFMTLFSAFAITSLTFGVRYISAVEAVPISPEDEMLGYSCLVVPGSPTITHSTFTIVAYLNLARTSLVAIAGLATLLVRYRRQDNTLLNVIRREGGIYYLSTIVLRICDAIFRTPGSPAKDEYKIVQVYVTSIPTSAILTHTHNM
ncbi:hypothetical protein MD484_g6535, partial [Candolleomyces efflorescens]